MSSDGKKDNVITKTNVVNDKYLSEGNPFNESVSDKYFICQMRSERSYYDS